MQTPKPPLGMYLAIALDLLCSLSLPYFFFFSFSFTQGIHTLFTTLVPLCQVCLGQWFSGLNRMCVDG